MSEAPDNHELARQAAILEEKMRTMQADLSSTLERFRADMSKRDGALERFRADMSKRDQERDGALERLRADIAARETRLILTVILVVGLAVAVLGFLPGQPQPIIIHAAPAPSAAESVPSVTD